MSELVLFIGLTQKPHEWSVAYVSWIDSLGSACRSRDWIDWDQNYDLLDESSKRLVVTGSNFDHSCLACPRISLSPVSAHIGCNVEALHCLGYLLPCRN